MSNIKTFEELSEALDKIVLIGRIKEYEILFSIKLVKYRIQKTRRDNYYIRAYKRNSFIEITPRTKYPQNIYDIVELLSDWNKNKKSKEAEDEN